MGPYSDSLTGIRDTLTYGATSFAVPFVTALVALIRSVRPDLSAPEVVTLIQNSAKDIDPPGWDPYTGYGRVDFAKALKATQQGKKSTSVPFLWERMIGNKEVGNESEKH